MASQASAAAAAARDIQATSGRDNLTDVAARSVPVTRSAPLPLPTPPNSISPGLPPHGGIHAQLLKAKLEPGVPPFDLHDARNAAQLATGAHSPPDDPTGALTPAMLAKYHLADILLNNDGPTPIKDIMGSLTISVPGFAGLKHARARRLVVSALERGTGSEGGGQDGDVIFEKIGWGKWTARRKGEPLRGSIAQLSASPSMPGIPIAGGATWSNERTRIGGSLRDSPVFSHDDRGFYMEEDHADNMSLDESASMSSPEQADDDDVPMEDDPEDVTDEEDWAAIGAAGLRAASYGQSAPRPGTFPPRFTSSGMPKAPQLSNLDYSAMMGGIAPDAQERDAIEALLRLGSV